MSVRIASALIAVVAIVATVVGRASSTTAPLVRVTPGFVIMKPNFDLVVRVLNPTGGAQTVTGHLVSPNGFPTPADKTTTVNPHSTGQLTWACGVVNCDATPILTARSARLAYTVRYQDATGVLIDIRPGELKRVG